MSDPELYASTGFIGDQPTVRVVRTSGSVHLNIGKLTVLVDHATAIDLAHKILALPVQPDGAA